MLFDGKRKDKKGGGKKRKIEILDPIRSTSSLDGQGMLSQIIVDAHGCSLRQLDFGKEDRHERSLAKEGIAVAGLGFELRNGTELVGSSLSFHVGKAGKKFEILASIWSRQTDRHVIVDLPW